MQPVVCLVLAYLVIWLSCFDVGKPCLLITEELVGVVVEVTALKNT